MHGVGLLDFNNTPRVPSQHELYGIILIEIYIGTALVNIVIEIVWLIDWQRLHKTTVD